MVWGHIKEQLFVKEHKKQISDLHRVLWVYTIVFLVWGLYRMIIRLPVAVEEVGLKAVVFGLPVFWVVVHKEKKSLSSLGMKVEGLLVSMYLGIFLGIVMGVMGKMSQWIRVGEITFNELVRVAEFGNMMFLGLFTAFWEELLFMGFKLPRVVKDVKNEWVGVITVGVMFAMLHIPVQLIQGATPGSLVVRLILLFSLAVANGIIYLRFKNLAAPVFAHLVWGMTIYLFG